MEHRRKIWVRKDREDMEDQDNRKTEDEPDIPENFSFNEEDCERVGKLAIDALRGSHSITSVKTFL